jgi:hypothetical protein
LQDSTYVLCRKYKNCMNKSQQLALPNMLSVSRNSPSVGKPN